MKIIKPNQYSDRESNIYRAQCISIVAKDQNKLTDKIANPNADLYCIISIWNDGKNKHGRFIRSGYFVARNGPIISPNQYYWDIHIYATDINVTHYYHVYCSYITSTSCSGDIIYTIVDNHHAKQPTLGIKNRNKIKKAIKEYLSKL